MYTGITSNLQDTDNRHERERQKKYKIHKNAKTRRRTLPLSTKLRSFSQHTFTRCRATKCWCVSRGCGLGFLGYGHIHIRLSRNVCHGFAKALAASWPCGVAVLIRPLRSILGNLRIRVRCIKIASLAYPLYPTFFLTFHLCAWMFASQKTETHRF